MADTIKSSSELKLDSYYADGDTRMLSIPNPRADVTAADILAVAQSAVTNQPLLGDKGGANFVRFNSAKIVEKTKVDLDLS